MKVAVCNSVGIDADGYAMIHSPSRWTNSTKDHNIFTYYPWQLACCSSILKRDTDHEVKFFDGCLEKWDHDTFVEKISEFGPDYLVMDCATRTIDADSRFGIEVKKRFGTKLIFCGPHPTTFPEEVSEYADPVVLREYEMVVLDILQGKALADIMGLWPNTNIRPPLDVNNLPLPEDDDVSRLHYGMPGEPSSEYLEIQAYASRGCPLSCTFCVCGNISYQRPNWRPRNVASVVEEIRTLHEKYPEMEGVFFDEEVHNIKRSFNISLAKAIRSAGLDHLKYQAMCEYASLDEEALEEMRAAGYYKIRFGIETGSDKVAEKMTPGKKHDLQKLRAMVKFGKSLGMLFYGTISIGGLGSSQEEDQKTVDLVYEMASKGWLDEIQVSINTPQPGTDFYNSCMEESLLPASTSWEGFDGNGQVVSTIRIILLRKSRPTLTKPCLLLIWEKSRFNRRLFQTMPNLLSKQFLMELIS